MKNLKNLDKEWRSTTFELSRFIEEVKKVIRKSKRFSVPEVEISENNMNIQFEIKVRKNKSIYPRHVLIFTDGQLLLVKTEKTVMNYNHRPKDWTLLKTWKSFSAFQKGLS